jgi:ubiquinone/menaquinone biosynthesis C-methylase UbiE
MTEKTPEEILAHYASADEDGRCHHGHGQLERLRTQELLERFLPPSAARVVDVGGGTGVYAAWLAARGYEVHLVDPVPQHIEKARELCERSEHPIASCTLGDASKLHHPDESVEVVLMLGPLYHITGRDDRIAALSEARRVLRPGGTLAAAAISRLASAMDGIFRGLLSDPRFAQIVRQDLATGHHRNPTDNPSYFTTAYFHRPEEVREELEQAGLEDVRVLPVEGPAWVLQDFDGRFADDDWRNVLFEVLRLLEDEPSILGASAHLLAVGTK